MDRKHQVPLNPLDPIHPITKEEWANDVYTRDDGTNSNKYMLERSGRMAVKMIEHLHGIEMKDKNDIQKYNVYFIRNHPELYGLPCCGKKYRDIQKNDMIEYVDRTTTPVWRKGVIIKNLSNGYYEIKKIDLKGNPTGKIYISDIIEQKN